MMLAEKVAKDSNGGGTSKLLGAKTKVQALHLKVNTGKNK